LDGDRGIDVVDMADDEFHVIFLTRPAEILGARAQRDAVDRGAVPARDNLARAVVFRREAGVEKEPSYPGAAELVLLAKFSSCAGTDDSNSRVMAGEVGGGRAVVPQAGDIDRLGPPR